MPTVHVDSRKHKIGKDQTYVLGAGDIVTALEPRLVANVHLALVFLAKQPYRKPQRDAVEVFKVLSCAYGPGRGVRLPAESDRAWAAEQWPQIVDVEVVALPRRILPVGVSLRGPTKNILALSFAALAPAGLPAKDRSPGHAWLLDVEYEKSVSVLCAILKPWDGGQFAVSRRLELPVPGMLGNVGPGSTDGRHER